MITQHIANMRKLPEDKKQKLLQQLAHAGVSPLSIPIVKVNEKEALPLAYNQEQLWFLQQYDSHVTNYNIYVVYKIQGNIDSQFLNQAFALIQERHAILRTRFVLQDKQLCQVIDDEVKVSIERITLDHQSSEAQRDTVIQSVINTQFDLAKGPLLVIKHLVQSGQSDYIVFCVHHIIMDGISLGILFNELQQQYNYLKNNTLPAPVEPEWQYADYACWQREWFKEPLLAQDLNYWRERLHDAPRLSTFPTLYSRPAVPSQAGAKISITFDALLNGAIKRLASEQKTTPFVLLLTAFKLLLLRYTNQQQLIIGTPVSGRIRPELLNSIGFYASVVLIYSDFSTLITAHDALRQVKKNVKETFGRQKLPFEMLLNSLNIPRQPSHSPLFQILYIYHYQVNERNFSLADAQWKQLNYHNNSVKYDMTVEVFDNGDTIDVTLEYNSGLYNEAYVQNIAEAFRQYCIALTVNLQIPINQISSFNQSNGQYALQAFNATDVTWPAPHDLLTLIQQISLQQSDQIVIQGADYQMSWQMLWLKVQTIATRLKAHGIQLGDRVGVLIPRHGDLIATMLAIWYVGAVYLPFDINQPSARVRRLMQRAGLTCLVVREYCEYQDIVPLLLLELDQLYTIPELPSDNLRMPILLDAPAYILFTSGSTGEPKGVTIKHGSLLNLLLDMQQTFAVDKGSRLLSVTTPAFDISFLEYLLPLISGASLYIAEAEIAADSFAMIKLINEYQPTLMQATPSFWQALLTAGWQGNDNLCVLAGGEALPVHTAEGLLNRCQTLWNLYGPTETTIWSLKAKVIDFNHITIGSPIANTRIYILDEKGNPVPSGVVGELYIAGAGVAMGYDGQTELTDKHFLAEPSHFAGAKMFRTGDLVSCDPHGNLRFIGRKDTQIKLRGYRIELGEIERVIAQHIHVESAVVVCIDNAQVDKLLAVAVITMQDVDFNALKHELQQQLPDYMIPTLWQKVEHYPLTANGKIDRKQLADSFVLDREASQPQTFELNEQEQALMTLWMHFLPIKNPDPNSDFFSLGGHSLLAVTLLAEINREFACALTLKDIFHYANVRALTARITQLQAQNIPMVAQTLVITNNQNARYQPFPLTDVQRAYWIGRQTGNSAVATHVYHEFAVNQFDLIRFSQALSQLIARHDMLRAIVLPDGTQQILAQVPEYQIAYHDLRGLTPHDSQNALQTIRAELSHKVHVVDHWPLFDFSYTQCSEQDGRLHFSLDLLIADAVSMRTLQRELITLYQQPATPLPVLPFSFRDYVQALQVEQAGTTYQRDKAYWEQSINQLYGPPRLPIKGDLLLLPDIKFVRRSCRLSVEKWRSLTQIAQAAHVTKTGLLLTVFSQVLARWCSQPAFTLNLTLFNRPMGYLGAEAVIGDFTAVSLLNIHYDSQRSYAENAQIIQGQLWDDLDHRRYSGIRVNEALIRSGRFQSPMPVVFTSVLDNADGELSAQVVEGFTLLEDANITQTPQVWLDHQVLESGGELHFNWDVVNALFDPTMIDAMFTTYCQTLIELANQPQRWQMPESSLSLPRLSAPVEQKPVPTRLMHYGLLHYAELTPEAIALITSNQRLTYRQLSGAANNIAKQLQALGVKRGDRVAVMMKKGWEQIVAVHAILRLGAIYLPIDPVQPVQRQSLLLAEGEVCAMVTQPQIELADPIHLPVVVVMPAMLKEATKPLNVVEADITDIAYIIFTSGSTGVPKGVMIDHRAAMNTLEDINQRFSLQARDRVFGLSSLSFDLSVFDAFAPFMVGAALVLPDAGFEKDPQHWLDMLNRAKVTVWNSVPALMQMLCEYQNGCSASCPQLRLALLSGDWIPLTLPGQMRSRLNQTLSIISLGGATECAIWSVFYPIMDLDPHWTSIPYGRGLRNQPIYVLNEQLEECPVGVEGEIYIGGMGLAQGYLNDPDKTAASFVWRKASAERIYRTGDLGRYFADGQIEFLGRKDTQVKVNGFRIELGEIQCHLERLSSVNHAAVVFHQGHIYAFITTTLTTDIVNNDEIIDGALVQLQQSLPVYMIPQGLYIINALPMTSNGKIDRAALIREVINHMSTSASESTVTTAATSSYEQQVSCIWCELLQKPQVGLEDNFFEAGGGSIQIVLMHRRIEEKFNVTIPIAELFRLTTVKKIADYLQAKLDNVPDVSHVQHRDASQLRAQQRLQRRHKRQR
ncbi:non-ribosomal peptide synthetase [Gilliamella sp. App4-10]|uniref:non-ribosomal peptide synthetase n=1 Tax=Gilliamella sp. App4-10 TaxID=3120231 RepID=UPI00080E40A6|nr:non-ribosomal peptide synthetase [Gilliamella apicola]OCG21783.1 non-ribosomal peptide synthetase [Gilliamella apicola]